MKRLVLAWSILAIVALVALVAWPTSGSRAQDEDDIEATVAALETRVAALETAAVDPQSAIPTVAIVATTAGDPTTADLTAWLERYRRLIATGDVQGLINLYGEFATLDLGFDAVYYPECDVRISVGKGPREIACMLRAHWDGVIERLVTLNDVTIGGEGDRGAIRLQYTQETYRLDGCTLSEVVEAIELDRQSDGTWLITSHVREYQIVEQPCSREREEPQNKLKLLDVAFAPPFLTVRADQSEEVILINVGALPHNFSIDALNISVDLAPGEVVAITIDAPEGEYEFYCNQPGHRDAGMTGTLTAR